MLTGNGIGSTKLQFKHLLIEERGKFRIEGELSIERHNLDGTIRLGIAPAYLDWLPVANEVFAEHRDGLLWTTVHISGTTEKPKQDLSPRIGRRH